VSHDHQHQPHHRGHRHWPQEHRTRLRAAAAELLRPHRHEAADQVDLGLESSERGLRAVKVSFVALMLTAVVQAGLIIATGSVALLADTIHNVSDALTAVPLFIAFRLSRRPPTRRYTYGYRRAEDLAGVFVLAAITLSAVVVGYEAIDRLIHPQPLTNIGWVFAAGLIGFAGNELVAVYRIRVGRQIGSAALEADGTHARTDGFTSLAVAVGALGTWLGFPRADAAVGLLITVAISWVLRGAARDIFRRLMDAVDPRIIDEIEQTTSQVCGVQRVGSVQARWVGHRLAASIAIDVDADLSVRQGHEVAEAVRHQLLHRVPHLDDVDVHVDPCDRRGDDSHALTRHHRHPASTAG
jgi:cation diffusion facilitator family transporter